MEKLIKEKLGPKFNQILDGLLLQTRKGSLPWNQAGSRIEPSLAAHLPDYTFELSEREHILRIFDANGKLIEAVRADSGESADKLDALFDLAVQTVVKRREDRIESVLESLMERAG